MHEARSAPDIEAIRRLVQDDVQAVDRLIRARLYSDVVLINQLSHYIIAGGGKRNVHGASRPNGSNRILQSVPFGPIGVSDVRKSL